MKKNKLSTKQFIEKANKIHDFQYDYSLTEYINNRANVEIICKEHGSFFQNASGHLRGYGCIKCAKYKKRKKLAHTKKAFIQKANKIHNNKYDYDSVEYINNSTVISIVCKEHGIFNLRPREHLLGRGCVYCSDSRRLTTKEFVAKAKTLHNNKYDYSLVEYKNYYTKVKIICPEHGMFKQIPSNHIHHKKYGCSKCGKNKRLTTKEFVAKANNIHNNKYVYDKTEYVSYHRKVKIKCKNHDCFYQTPASHLNGNGCPKCFGKISKNQIKLYNSLKEHYEVYLEYPIIIDNNKYFADLYIKNKNIIIEYYGDYWHCNPKKYKSNYFHPHKKIYAKNIWDYDKQRINKLKQKGNKVFIIWESDFKQNKEETLSFLKKI